MCFFGSDSQCTVCIDSQQDLKADNILVEPTGVCKISDFGISKKASDLHQGGRAHTMMRGTVYWMAPEVVSSNGGQGYDLKVDIWSVGCIALEMWSGRRPWNDLPMMPVMFKVIAPTRPPNAVLILHSSSRKNPRLQCPMISSSHPSLTPSG